MHTQDTNLHAEARRLVQKANPALTDEEVADWLASVDAHCGRLVLTFDGSCFAEYGDK
ncbi:MAG TPA: hypothetical protein VHW01_13260 [Polyangiaceae bacterium]|jgi:hypothetical protein|nr:hypothetical protein [Polyangiaceae bacterium]